MPNRRRGINPILPGIVALMGVVVILMVMGWGRIQDANERADAAEARVEYLRERVADTGRLQEAVIRLAREVERLRALVLSLGGDPGSTVVEASPAPSGGGSPPGEKGKTGPPGKEGPPGEDGGGNGEEGNGEPPPSPALPPDDEPPDDPGEICIPVVDVCV